MASGTTGIALVLVIAYKIFKTPAYQEAAEKLLSDLPERPVTPDFTVFSGITGWGLVYNMASQVFDNPQWKAHATWIADVLLHTYKEVDPKAGYWNTDGAGNYDASFLTGTTGVIIFLDRFLKTGFAER